MSKELKEDVAVKILKLVLTACKKDGLYISTTIGNTYDTDVYIHDLRNNNSTSVIYSTDKERCKGKQENGIRYIYDPEFVLAERHLVKIIEEASDEGQL